MARNGLHNVSPSAHADVPDPGKTPSPHTIRHPRAASQDDSDVSVADVGDVAHTPSRGGGANSWYGSRGVHFQPSALASATTSAAAAASASVAAPQTPMTARSPPLRASNAVSRASGPATPHVEVADAASNTVRSATAGTQTAGTAMAHTSATVGADAAPDTVEPPSRTHRDQDGRGARSQGQPTDSQEPMVAPGAAAPLFSLDEFNAMYQHLRPSRPAPKQAATARGKPPTAPSAVHHGGTASESRALATKRLKLLLALRYLRAYFTENCHLRALLSHVLVHRRYARTALQCVYTHTATAFTRYAHNSCLGVDVCA